MAAAVGRVVAAGTATALRWLKDAAFGTALRTSYAGTDVEHEPAHTLRAHTALVAGGWLPVPPLTGTDIDPTARSSPPPESASISHSTTTTSDSNFPKPAKTAVPRDSDEVTGGSSTGATARSLQAAVTTEIQRQTLGLLHETPVRTFTLARRPCSNGYGDGVFVAEAADGAIAPGQVVAFFPGLVYHGVPDGATMDDPVPVWEGIRQSFAANDKRINLRCGGFIDGMQWELDHADPSRLPTQTPAGAPTVDIDVNGQNTSQPAGAMMGALDLDEITDTPLPSTSEYANAYAVGHLCNHPDATAVPNVIDWTILLDVPALVEVGVPRERIPYAVHDVWYFSKEMGVHVPAPLHAPLPAKVMVATREIPIGDELLFDYNLSGATAARQPWYTSRDAAADSASEAGVSAS
eukprot:m.23151 g.23151  ORF g.23151 m.23151 type:complete len:408 (-) comp5913_c0_seq1:64-1287(-)